MSRRRGAQCCCNLGNIQGCKLWQSICNGTTTAAGMPNAARLTASGDVSYLYKQCCEVGGTQFLIREFTGTMTADCMGTKVLLNPASGPCRNAFYGTGVDFWAVGDGVRYLMSGTWQQSLTIRESVIQYDDFGNCIGTSLCFEDAYQAAGTFSGCALCGVCPFPIDPAQPCTCFFSGGNCIFYQGWQLFLNGTGSVLGHRNYLGDCCAQREKAGLSCYEPFEPFDITAEATATFKASCDNPVSEGCQTIAQGGCSPPPGGCGDMGTTLFGVPLCNQFSQDSECYVIENRSGTARFELL